MKTSQKKSSKTFFKFRKYFLNFLKLGITLGIFYFLYEKGLLDLTRVKTTLSNPLLFITCFFALFSTAVTSVIRWSSLLKAQNLNVPFRETFELSMIGTFFNTAIPGAVSGDVVKGYYVVKKQSDGRGKIRAFTTLLLDRLLGLSALIFISFCVMLFNLKEILDNPSLRPLCGMISLLGVGFLLFYIFVLVDWPFSKKLMKILSKLPAGQHLSKLYEAFKAYERCRGIIYKGLAISILNHTILISVILLIAKNLGGFENVPAERFYFLVPFGLLVTAIPVAPAGLGTGHFAFYKLFAILGSVAGADLFMAYVTFQILISLIGGIFYIKYREKMPNEITTSEAYVTNSRGS